MVKNNKINKKGFTLIELLVVISILALVLSITIYSITSVLKNARQKTYSVTVNEIEKAAGDYLLENSDEIFFVPDSNNKTESQCVLVKELVEYGFLNKDIVNSKIDESTNVSLENYVYIERDINTKTISKKNLIFQGTPYDDMCELSVKTTGVIYGRFKPSINSWSKTKAVTIDYVYDVRGRDKNDDSVNDIKYEYEYFDEKDTSIVKISDLVNPKEYTITQKGYLYADIANTSISKSWNISKIDALGPVVKLVNNDNKTVKREVTIPLEVSDYGIGTKTSSFTNEDIVVKVGGKELDSSLYELTFKGQNSCSSNDNVETCYYDLIIKNKEYDGKVSLIIKDESIEDKLGNLNDTVTLDTNIIFNNACIINLDSNGATTKGTEKVYSKYDIGIYLDDAYTKKMSSDSNNIVIPKKIGYTFDGYYSNQNGEGTQMIDANGFKTNDFESTNYPGDTATLYAKWTINKVYIMYGIRSDEYLNTTNSDYTHVDGEDIIRYKGSEIIQIIDYGATIGGDGLYNYNNSNYINIVKTGYTGVSGKQWICIDGCKVENSTFSQASDAKINANDLCEAKFDDCTVTLAVNWQPITYNIEYNLNNGTAGSNSPTTAKYNETISISHPTKSVTFVGHANNTSGANGTDVNIGNNTTHSLTFSGWKIENSSNYSNSVLYNDLSFINLRDKAGTVSMTANWKASSNLELPSITKTDYSCGWTTESNGTTLQYMNGEKYPKGNITSTSPTTINLYAVCERNYEDILGERCYSEDHNIYYITSCQKQTQDESGNNTNEAKCNYTKKNGIPATGQLIRRHLRAVSECQYTVTYDCKTNGGTTDNSSEKFSANSSANLSKSCAKSGWQWVGWNTDKDATSGLSSYTVTGNVTLYGIYKKVLTLKYNGNNFGISVPDNNIYGTTCSDNNNCESKCTVYNKQTSCSTSTPKINTSSKTYFSVDKNDTSFDSGVDLWRNANFGLTITRSNENKTYYVTNDQINAKRYSCTSYSGYGYRMRVFYITTCNGTTCTFTSLNGIAAGTTSSFAMDVNNPITSWTVSRSQLSDALGTSCYKEYYINGNSSSELSCLNAAKSNSGQKVKIKSNCAKLASYKTTMKVNDTGTDNWYYVADKDCYVNGSALQSAYPSGCTTSNPPPTNNNGNYYVYFDANGGSFKTWLGNLPSGCTYISSSNIGSGEYTRVKCTYGNKFYLSNLKNTFSKAGSYYFVSWTFNGGARTSYVDAEESGGTLLAYWRKQSSSGGGSGGGGCFLAGTKVMTINGYKDINKVKVGDMVLTYNEATKNNEYHKVVNLFAFDPNEIDERLYTLKFDDKTTLKVSSTHRFYVKRNNETNWIPAKELKYGDIVMYSNKKYHRIISIKDTELKNTVYNLSVENTHNFYVGNQQVLVHNTYECVTRVHCTMLK